MRLSFLFLGLAAMVSAVPVVEPDFAAAPEPDVALAPEPAVAPIPKADAAPAPEPEVASGSVALGGGQPDEKELREKLKEWGYRQGAMAHKSGFTITASQKHPDKAPLTFTRTKAHKQKWRKLGKPKNRGYEAFHKDDPGSRKKTPREKCNERCKAITNIWPFTMWCKLCKAIYTE